MLSIIVIKICNSTTVNKDESSKLNEKGECINSGYYIDNNRVNINIGSINCANDIEIINLKVDKSRNVKGNFDYERL